MTSGCCAITRRPINRWRSRKNTRSQRFCSVPFIDYGFFPIGPSDPFHGYRSNLMDSQTAASAMPKNSGRPLPRGRRGLARRSGVQRRLQQRFICRIDGWVAGRRIRIDRTRVFGFFGIARVRYAVRDEGREIVHGGPFYLDKNLGAAVDCLRIRVVQDRRTRIRRYQVRLRIWVAR